MTARASGERLRKELGLVDVYAISTGAMFSSGFFLLPGLAAAGTGASVPLAYLVAGLFLLPAMLSVAELATAMPKAGGAYFFLDRSLGPLVGTVGGLGTWVALVLKTAFALVGMGAYLALYIDVPIEPLAIALTVLFAVVNVVGAKETSGLQRALVAALLVILAGFMVQGLLTISLRDPDPSGGAPFFTAGLTGFMATVGFVFVSYAGLTKVASVAEEVRDPDRNIPLGMALSLGTAALTYTVGVWIMVQVLPMAELTEDLTPAASAAAVLFEGLPGGAGLILVVVAAVAAFASTGNAGILSASRYPLAMARDRLISPRLAALGRFRTPTLAILATAVMVGACILVLDVESIAKLASAFQLLLFSLLCLAVIVMRESGIEGYDPGYRAPLYPWLQLVGFLAPFWLIAEMGHLPILFSLGLVTLAIGWYFAYGRSRVVRSGAIFHTLARLGERRHTGIDDELRGIVREKGLRDEDPFEEVVARAPVLELAGTKSFPEVIAAASEVLVRRTELDREQIEAALVEAMDGGLVPVARGVALPHLRISGLERPVLVLARCRTGLPAAGSEGGPGSEGAEEEVRAVFFLLSPSERPGQHLRLLGHLATHVDDPAFLERWTRAVSEAELRATLLRHERSVTLRVGGAGASGRWAGRPLRSLGLPRGTLVAVVRRDGRTIVPDGSSVLEDGDHLTIIGSRDGIREVAALNGNGDRPPGP